MTYRLHPVFSKKKYCHNRPMQSYIYIYICKFYVFFFFFKERKRKETTITVVDVTDTHTMKGTRAVYRCQM